MWDLESSQRVEYQVAGRRCVSFTMRLSVKGMALRTAAQLVLDTDVLFSIALADPSKPVQLNGRVTRREADKAWIEFSDAQAGLEQIREYIRMRVVPDVEKALSQGTVCVTRIHGLAEFCAEFLPAQGVSTGSDSTAVTNNAINAAEARAADLHAQLMEANAANAELAQRLAAAEQAAASAAAEPIMADAAQLMTLPGDDLQDAGDTGPGAALSLASLKKAINAQRKIFAAVGAASFVVGVCLTFALAKMTASETPDAVPPTAAATADTPAPAAALAAPAPAAAAPAAAPTPAPTAAAPAPAAAAPEPAVAPPPPVAPAPAAAAVADERGTKRGAPVRKSAPTARTAPRRAAPAEPEEAPPPSSKPSKSTPKSASAEAGKDDAFLDSVFP